MEGLGVADLRIHDAIDDVPVFENALSQDTLLNEANLLKHTHGGWVPGKYWGLQSFERRVYEDMRCHCSSRSSGNSLAPVRLTKPITELGCIAGDAFACNDTGSTNSFAFNFNGHMNAPAGAASDGKPVLRIGFRVRMRKRFGEIPPDSPVVGVTDERGLILAPP